MLPSEKLLPAASAGPQTSIRLVLARPEEIAHYEQVLRGALAHGLRLDQMLDLTVRGDLDHLARCSLVKRQRPEILSVHLLHRGRHKHGLRLVGRVPEAVTKRQRPRREP